jgi:hypothetical protein
MIHSIIFDATKHPITLGKSKLTFLVLNNHQRVCTVYSLQKTLGYDGKFEKWLFEFLNDISQINTINLEILKALEIPLLFESSTKNKAIEKAIDCKYIIPILQAITTEKNKKVFNSSQLKIYRKALDLFEILKNADIETFVDEKIGYKIYKEKIIEKNSVFLENQTKEQALKWTKTIPIAFFDSVFNMNHLDWETINQNQMLFFELINEIIFSRIDKSLIEELRNVKPKRTYKRKNDLTQEVQHPKLKEHLAVLITLMNMSGNNWNIFIQLLHKAFPNQNNDINIHIHQALNKETPLSDFNEKLIKVFN